MKKTLKGKHAVCFFLVLSFVVSSLSGCGMMGGGMFGSPFGGYGGGEDLFSWEGSGDWDESIEPDGDWSGLWGDPTGDGGSADTEETEEPVDFDTPHVSPATGMSAAFSFEPIPGMTISAGENALDKDREFSVREVSEAQAKRVAELFVNEESDEVPLAMWDISCGLSPEERLPGHFSVDLDLNTLDIPKELWDYLRVYRIDDEGESFLYRSRVEGRILHFDSRQNSTFVIVGSIILAGLLVHMAVIDEYYFLNKETFCCEGEGHKIYWVMEDLEELDKHHNASDFGKQYKEMTTRLKRAIEDAKKSVLSDPSGVAQYGYCRDSGGGYTRFLSENANYLEKVRKRLEQDTGVKALVQEINDLGLPPFIKALDDAIDQSMAFHEWYGTKQPYFKTRFYVKKNLADPTSDAEAEQHQRIFNTATIDVVLKQYVNDDDELYAKNLEVLKFTIVHEYFHACQHEYYLGSSFFVNLINQGLALRLFEATAAGAEMDAYRYFKARGYIPILSGYTRKELQLTRNGLDKGLTPTYYPHFMAWGPDEKRADSNSGYALWECIDYFNDHYNKLWMSDVMSHFFTLNGDFSTVVARTCEIDGESFRKRYLEFLTDLRDNRISGSQEGISNDESFMNCVSYRNPTLALDAQTKFTISADISHQVGYLKRDKFTMSDSDPENKYPYSMLILTEAEKDGSLVQARPYDEPSLKTYGSGDEAVLFAEQPPKITLFTELWEIPQLPSLEEAAGEMALPWGKIHVYLLPRPINPITDIREDFIEVSLMGPPDDFTRDAIALDQNDELPRGVEHVGISVRLIRDDGEEFEVDDIFPVRAWKDKLRIPIEDYLAGYQGEYPSFEARVRECITAGGEELYGPESVPEDNDIFGLWDVEVRMPKYGSSVLDQAFNLRPDELQGMEDQQYWNAYQEQMTNMEMKGTMNISRSVPSDPADPFFGDVENLSASIVYENNPYSDGPVRFTGTYNRLSRILTLKQTIDTSVYSAEEAAQMAPYMPEITINILSLGEELTMEGGSQLDTDALSYEFRIKGKKRKG